jgi:hypothetical protein
MTNKMIQIKGSSDGKLTNRIINLFLLFGVSIMIFTLFYLLFHLDTSDKIIYRCIPGFALGLFSILVYGFLYHKKSINKRRIHL